MSSTRDLVRVVKFPELGSPSDVESQRAFWGPWERRLPTGEPLPMRRPGQISRGRPTSGRLAVHQESRVLF